MSCLGPHRIFHYFNYFSFFAQGSIGFSQELQYLPKGYKNEGKNNKK
jgi:hypothetical protein